MSTDFYDTDVISAMKKFSGIEDEEKIKSWYDSINIITGLSIRRRLREEKGFKEILLNTLNWWTFKENN